MSCDTCRFDATSESVAGVRRFIGAHLSDFDANEISDVVLMSSELATNAIRYGGTDIEVTLVHESNEGFIRVEVRDEGGGDVVRNVPGAYDERGRGLQIVDQLADRWGTREAVDGPGKTVWFVMIVRDTVAPIRGSREVAPEEALDRDQSAIQPLPESVR